MFPVDPKKYALCRAVFFRFRVEVIFHDSDPYMGRIVWTGYRPRVIDEMPLSLAPVQLSRWERYSAEVMFDAMLTPCSQLVYLMDNLMAQAVQYAQKLGGWSPDIDRSYHEGVAAMMNETRGDPLSESVCRMLDGRSWVAIVQEIMADAERAKRARRRGRRDSRDVD